MDLLGGYNSDSDDDNDSSSSIVNDVTTKGARAVHYKKPVAWTSMQTEKLENIAEKKKHVVGKKLLKLSAVLPHHILNQLQLSGGGVVDKNKGDYSSDTGNSSSDDETGISENPSTRRKIKTSIRANSSSKYYSRDEGLMGLLSELSRSNASGRKEKSTKILNNVEDSSSSTKECGHDSLAIPASIPLAQSQSTEEVATNEPLGAAFLNATVQSMQRKRKDPMLVRSIHENPDQNQVDERNEEMMFFEVESNFNQLQSKASIIRSNDAFIYSQSPTENIVPQQRILATSSLRSAAPPIRISSVKSSSDKFNTDAPVISRRMNNSYDRMHQKDSFSIEGRTFSKKKKPMSRKRQMEQMLRAGKFDEVHGDHELRGASQVYNQDSDFANFATSNISSSSNGIGVRMVPTGTYDSSTGATAMTTDVTSRQKVTNQLNSLLANAASLESHRAQNPQIQFMSGKGNTGSHRTTAKRKYGW